MTPDPFLLFFPSLLLFCSDAGLGRLLCSAKGGCLLVLTAPMAPFSTSSKNSLSNAGAKSREPARNKPCCLASPEKMGTPQKTDARVKDLLTLCR